MSVKSEKSGDQTYLSHGTRYRGGEGEVNFILKFYIDEIRSEVKVDCLRKNIVYLIKIIKETMFALKLELAKNII